MKRLLGAALAIFLFVIVGAQPSYAQNLNAFTISSYDIAYELSRASDGHSQLKTTERITVFFPFSNVNHGIERYIPVRYDSRTLSLNIDSITDDEGKDLRFTYDESDDMARLRIGDPDKYVRGTQVYVITYTQKDVTRYYSDTGRDEWYWDTNGVQWKVPIRELSISVAIEDGVKSAQKVSPSCYFGKQGEDSSCDIKEKDGVYHVSKTNLEPGDNISVAFGFAPETFTPYTKTIWDWLYWWFMTAQIIAVPLSVFIFIWALVQSVRKTMRSQELQPIPVQYIPPADCSVSMASKLVTGRSPMSAQLIDLAVRRYIALVETKPKTAWKTAEYEIHIKKDISDLRVEEKEILLDMFGHEPKVGESLALESLRNNLGYSKRVFDNFSKFTNWANNTYKLYEKNSEASRYFYSRAALSVVAAIALLSPFVLVAAAITAVIGATIRPLSDEGLRLRRYILGLDKYVDSTEAERLAFLQGPDTAEKVGFTVDTNDARQMVKLYERTLPYAVLFGHERQWSRELGELYLQTGGQPDWYASQSGVFNAAAFSAGVTSFADPSTTGGYSGGSSSSSYGGSGGGGFSGGGGGGGGGGGW